MPVRSRLSSTSALSSYSQLGCLPWRRLAIRRWQCCRIRICESIVARSHTASIDSNIQASLLRQKLSVDDAAIAESSLDIIQPPRHRIAWLRLRTLTSTQYCCCQSCAVRLLLSASAIITIIRSVLTAWPQVGCLGALRVHIVKEIDE